MKIPAAWSRQLRFPVLMVASLCLLTGASAHTAVEAVPKDGRWMARHESFVEIARSGGVDVLFLGDSITDFWRSAGRSVWDREWAPLKAANFGISADRTQHVLWRIRNGELDGIDPKVIVLMIGTNNTGMERGSATPRNTPAEAIDGVKAVVQELRSRRPSARILLLGIFPRGEPGDLERRQIAEINAAISRLHDGDAVTYLDIGDQFLAPDGSIPADVMPDKLHPGEKGYEIWAAAMKEPLTALLRRGP